MEKPVCKLSGQNGNIFHLMGLASRALKEAGQREEALEMVEQVSKAKSYEEALSILGEYVQVE